MPQETVLLERSILENARFGRLDAADDEVHQACKAAYVHDKIMTFLEGYDTRVTGHATTLTRGEKQRISIARCLLKDSPILSLVSHGHIAIQRALNRSHALFSDSS